ncbi:MAG: hypothetical protein H3C34_26410, partial [Caldilineaceae bacterium]|nr:hypothetical protein [Caldilineaceae bacterium]
CPGTFGELQGRLCAVLFHELIHATGQGEFDAEVFENLIYPPSVAASGNNEGGTWPYNDCEDFCTDTTLRADGLRETAHFIWNPTTGEVWRRKADGSKDGNPLWTDAEILKKWQCRCPDTKKERRPGAPVIDRFEPGDRSFTEPREEEQPPVGDDELKEIRRLLEEIRRRIQELERRISEREGKPGAPGEGYPHEREPGEGEGQPGYPHEGGQEGGGQVFIDRSEPGDVANP